jgi:hypothetical protein
MIILVLSVGSAFQKLIVVLWKGFDEPRSVESTPQMVGAAASGQNHSNMICKVA